MLKLYVKVKNTSPMLITEKRQSLNFMESLDYIPGATIRGALAHNYLQRGGKVEDTTFGKIFLNDKVYFGNLYPRHGVYTQVIPLSARTCKRYSGFHDDEPRKKEHHGMEDFLSRYALMKVSGNRQLILDKEKCKTCEAQLDRAKMKFCDRSNDGFYQSLSITHCIMPHTAIHRATRTVQSGLFYSHRVVEAGQTFEGWVTLVDDTLKTQVEDLWKDEHLRVGAARSRGMGQLEILQVDTTPVPLPSVATRLQDFNTELHSLAKQYQVSLGDGIYFAVTLRSDVIMRDLFWRYRARIEEDNLASVLGLNSSDIDLVYHINGQRPISGWNAAVKMPKEDALAITMGSVFLFRAAANVPRNKLESILQSLEMTGIGERRAEGFGAVTVCNPFHWEVQEL